MAKQKDIFSAPTLDEVGDDIFAPPRADEFDVTERGAWTAPVSFWKRPITAIGQGIGRAINSAQQVPPPTLQVPQESIDRLARSQGTVPAVEAEWIRTLGMQPGVGSTPVDVAIPPLPQDPQAISALFASAARTERDAPGIALEQERLATIPEALRPLFGAGRSAARQLQQGALYAGSLFGGDDTRAALESASHAANQEQSGRDTAMGSTGRLIDRAGSNLLTMAVNPGGAYGMITQAMLTQAGQSYADAIEAGKTPEEARDYAVWQALAEGAPATAMQRLGAGGLEQFLANAGKSSTRVQLADALRRALSTTVRQELPEELATTLAQQQIQTTIDPTAMDNERLAQALGDTIAQTIAMGGMAHALPAGQAAVSDIGKLFQASTPPVSRAPITTAPTTITAPPTTESNESLIPAQFGADMAPPAPVFTGGPSDGGITEQPGNMAPNEAAAAITELFNQQQDQEATQDELDRWAGTQADTTDLEALAREMRRAPPYKPEQAPSLAVPASNAQPTETPVAEQVPPSPADEALAGLSPAEKRKRFKDEALAKRQAEQAKQAEARTQGAEPGINDTILPSATPAREESSKTAQIQNAAPSSPSQLEHYRAFVASLSPDERTAVAADLKAVGETPADPFSAMQGIRQSLEMAKAVAQRKASRAEPTTQQAWYDHPAPGNVAREAVQRLRAGTFDAVALPDDAKAKIRAAVQSMDGLVKPNAPIRKQFTSVLHALENANASSAIAHNGIPTEISKDAPSKPADKPSMDAGSGGVSRSQANAVSQAKPVASDTARVQAGNRDAESVSPSPVSQAQPTTSEKLAGQRTEGAESAAPALTYDQYKAKMQSLLTQGGGYQGQAGERVMSEQMAALEDAHPEFAQRLDVESGAQPEKTPAIDTVTKVRQAMGSPPAGIKAWPERTVQHIADIADRKPGADIDLLVNTANTASRKAFTAVTGLRLPRTQRDSKVALERWMAGTVAASVSPIAVNPSNTKPVVSSESGFRATQNVSRLPSQGQSDGPATKSPTKSPTKSAITDVGEKIGGARKDRIKLADLEAMSDEERQTSVTRSSVWPEPDWAAMVADGMDATTAHLVRQAYADIAKSPGIDPKDRSDPEKRNAAIRTYVESVGKLRDALLAAKKPDDVHAAVKAEFPGLYLPGMGGYHGEGAAMRERDLARYRVVGRSNALANVGASKSMRRARTDVGEGWPNKAAWQSRYEVKDYGSVYVNPPPKPWRVVARGDEQRRAERQTPSDFATREEAEAEAQRRYEGLTRDQRGAEPQRPLNPDAKRVGKERRTGDINADDLRTTFGFRGIEFGNWSNQADRQQAITQAYDGLHDLAELIGVPPEAMSLNGALGLAFGARGKGRAAAHYEPGKVVINLTRTKGSGALAHEWAHAVDNYFGKLGSGGQVGTYSSADDAKITDAAGKAGVRPEVIEAWRAIRRAMMRRPDGGQSNYLIESRNADKGSRKYWSTPHEMFARAFEVWAAHKIDASGEASPYLVQGVPGPETTIETAGPWGRRYPVGEDAQRTNAAIDAWARTLKTEKTEKGTRLYAPEREPGADRLAMPDPAEGIESLIAWAMAERQRTINDLRNRVALGGPMAEEYQRDLDQHEAITPEELQRDMRAYPQHYARAMTSRGGNLSAIGVYRNRIQMPPQQPRVPVAGLPLAAGEAPDLRATLRALRENLKATAPSAPTFDVDKGALPDEAGGAFDTRSGGIVTRHHNDLDLVAHEVGHWASETFSLLPGVSDVETRAELARFAVHGTPARGDTAQREGMAEFLRAWMVNPGMAESLAPRFTQRLRSLMPTSVLGALRAYGDSVRRFEGATALQQMAAGQQRTAAAIDEQRRAGRWYTPLWNGIKEFLGKGIEGPRARPGDVPKQWKADAATKAQYHLTDKEAPQLANYLTSLALVGKDPAAMSPSQHWDFLRKGLRGVAAKIRDGVAAHGLPNIDGTAAVDTQTGQPMALPWLLESAPQDEMGFATFLDKAHAYGSAQRTLELADRFTNKAEKEISDFVEAQLNEAGGDKLRMGHAERQIRAFAEERRKALRLQLARLTAAGGGIRSATEVARQAVAEMADDPQRADIEEYLRRYRAWSNWNLQYAVDSDLLSPTQAETIRQANQFYIDWHRVFADEDGPVNLGEAVQGSSRTMHNPLASLLHATWGTIARGDRNRALLTFVAPLRLDKTAINGPSLAQLGRQISQEAADEAATRHHGFHDDGAGQKHRVYHTQRVVQDMNSDGSPVIGPDGAPIQVVKTEHWVFDPATEASLEAMRAESSDDPWSKMSLGLVNLQRLAITSAPSFRLRVPMRDNLDRLLNTEVGSSALDAVRGQRQTLTDPLTGEALDINQLYSQSGAAMAGWNRRTRDQALADVFAHVEDQRKQGYRWMTPGGAWRAWQKIGEGAENIARKAEFVAAFRKARTERGYSPLDASLFAMTQARGLLDTAESGRTIGRLNRWFLFLNAAIKGLERMTKISRAAASAYRRGDMTTGHRLTALMSVRLAVWGVSLAGLRLLTLSLLGDDEQEELLAAPAWKRDFSITLPDFGLGKIAIAKPYEWGFIGSGFERLADAAWASSRAAAARKTGDADAAKRWEEHASRAGEGWGRSGLTALLPIKFDDLMGGGLAPIAEVFFNKSAFTGASIIPRNESEKRLELRDRAQEASIVGRAISAVAAPILGDRFGDPRSIDHLVRGYLGGWGSAGTARDFGELLRRSLGMSAETSPYAERDVAFALDWAAKEGVASRKPFARLRELVKAARNADGPDRGAKLQTMRRAAQAIRRGIESNPRRYSTRATAEP